MKSQINLSSYWQLMTVRRRIVIFLQGQSSSSVYDHTLIHILAVLSGLSRRKKKQMKLVDNSIRRMEEELDLGERKIDLVLV